MTDNWQDQITDFFDGLPTEQQTLRLNEWIKSDPANGRRFVREAIIHSHLHDLITGEEAMRQQAVEETTLESGDTMVLPALSAADLHDEIDAALPPPPMILPQPQSLPIHRRPWFWAASIMIPLLGVFVYWLLPRPRSIATVAPQPRQHESTELGHVAQPPSFASVTATVNAQWGNSTGSDANGGDATAQVLAGQRVPGTPLLLRNGFAEIKFDTGATMIVEAPARFQVRTDNSVELTSGKISAKVPPAAHGFAVDTTTSRVIDFGTEFGVAISPGGSDEIQVFKGKVQAQPQAAGAAAPLMLTEGQAAVSTGHEIKLDPEGAQPQAFVRSLTPPASIDMVDLICGGDGTMHLRSGAIDQRTGESGQLTSRSGAGVVPSDYHNVPRLAVVNGCFVPNGKDTVDSSKDTFDFGTTSARTLYEIRAGGTFPWPTAGETFTAVLSGVDYSQPNHGLILLHPNAGITFDLDAIRRIHPGLKLARFRAVVGNTCPSTTHGTKAHVFVLVDGISRADLPELTFSNGAVNLDVSLTDTSRFLTIAITDDRKTVARNWIILGDPRLE